MLTKTLKKKKLGPVSLKKDLQVLLYFMQYSQEYKRYLLTCMRYLLSQDNTILYIAKATEGLTKHRALVRRTTARGISLTFLCTGQHLCSHRQRKLIQQILAIGNEKIRHKGNCYGQPETQRTNYREEELTQRLGW